jgi:prepilin-type N-terminal cleavage/methylation domain-containing protein
MRMQSVRRGRWGGFTLIEVMVVIAILAAMMAGGAIVIRVASQKQTKSVSDGNIKSLAAALEQVRSQDQLGRYPPSDILKLNLQGVDLKKLGVLNDTNVGIESLYVVFNLPGITVKPQGMDGEDKLGNLDDDKAGAMLGSMNKPDLFEYLDAWGFPLVYINASDYKDTSKVARYVLKPGEQPVVIKARMVEKTGQYFRPDTYQLFSVGPDGTPGTEDDLHFGD